MMLQQWADTLAARSAFPGLVADLIRASAKDIANIRFPSGDKGQSRGFDGVLEANGVAPYVPDGASIWEFGVSEGATAKANSDYGKRTEEVAEATRKETAFVFVTPRTWDNPKEKLTDWVKAKRKLGEWKSVEYLDGSMVEDWLAQCPAVAARYAKYELKTLPAAGIRSTDEYWDEYSTRFGPALVEQVLLAGRKALGEGGDQERVLAKQSREWADSVPGWPRAAAMLMRISDNWLREAERADLSAQKEALRW